MERNYDEVISEMLIELDQMHRESIELAQRNAKFDKRMDLTIARMVKAENRMEQFDKKLDESIKELKEFRRTQNEINKYFLKEMRKNGHKK